MKPLLVLLFIPTKYESNPSKNKGNIKLWKKVNQKVNLGRRLPDARLDITILKDGFFKKMSKNFKNLLVRNFWTNFSIIL